MNIDSELIVDIRAVQSDYKGDYLYFLSDVKINWCLDFTHIVLCSNCDSSSKKTLDQRRYTDMMKVYRMKLQQHAVPKTKTK